MAPRLPRRDRESTVLWLVCLALGAGCAGPPGAIDADDDGTIGTSAAATGHADATGAHGTSADTTEDGTDEPSGGTASSGRPDGTDGTDTQDTEDDGATGTTGADSPTWPPFEPTTYCDVHAPFETFEVVPGIEGWWARFSPDERVVLFVQTLGNGASQIFEAHRSDVTEPFGVPEPHLDADAISELAPTATPDGLTLYFARNDIGGSIFRAVRSSVDEPFDGVTEVFAQIGASVGDPYVGMDPGRVYLSSGRGTGLIYETWPEGAGLAEGMVINGNWFPGSGSTPVVTSDALSMYLRYSAPGVGLQRIAVTHRESTADTFPPPQPIPALTSRFGSIPFWISPDHCRLYYTHFDGLAQIRVASRNP